MPDHVHLALTPGFKDGRTISIPEITQVLKGVSAHRINKALGRRGSVWQEESFDRALRHEEDVDAKIFYMLENPVRAGLVANPLDYPWLWRNTSGAESISLAPTGEGARASTDKEEME
jgi:REP element-mobilizing transposase RayT